jgi:hypothetical protein
VAHEIGHLLLGPYGHSDRGIMRAPWTEAELEIARRGGLRFSDREAKRIRTDVAARIAAAAAQTSGLSPEAPRRAAKVSPR